MPSGDWLMRQIHATEHEVASWPAWMRRAAKLEVVMTAAFSIPCELTVTPGGDSRQNKFKLTASGETVFDDFQSNLSPEQIALCKQIAEAQSRLLHKWASV